jgi:hypothetical protein
MIKGIPSIMHVAIGVSFRNYTQGSNSIVQEITAEFTVNAQSKGTQTRYSDSSLRPTMWNTQSILHLYPLQQSLSSTVIFKVSMFDKVRAVLLRSLLSN